MLFWTKVVVVETENAGGFGLYFRGQNNSYLHGDVIYWYMELGVGMYFRAKCF
jgi:hypothetical protein